MVSVTFTKSMVHNIQNTILRRVYSNLYLLDIIT